MPSVKLYGTGSGSGNAVATVQIPNAGRLRGAHVSVAATSITAGALLRIEVSRASATEIAINGAQQCVLEVGLGGNFVTSGLAQYAINEFVPLDVPVVQGQLIYLHALISGTITYYAAINIIYG